MRTEDQLLQYVFTGIDIDAKTGCWNYMRAVDRKGYGKVYGNGTQTLAHRFVYSFYNGEIPEGLFACHHCDNPRCCNPDHIFIGTNADNLRDAARKGRLCGLSKKYTKRSGYMNKGSKITNEEALSIRLSNETNRNLATKYQVHIGTVRRIKKGERRPWI